MKKLYLTLALATLSTVGFAQTKVGGTPTINTSAMFEIESLNKGLLLPRLELEYTNSAAPLEEHVAGMTVYNTIKQNDVVPGFYYNDGTKWQQMVTTDNKAVKFFYMPSIVFDTGTITPNGTFVEKDLYQEYKNQFALTGQNHVKSANAPEVIPYFPSATDLYYYVTDYDATVFEAITIDENGLMKYRVIGNGSAYSIMNIVFVVKE